MTAQTDKKPFRIGCIGAGGISHAHATHIKRVARGGRFHLVRRSDSLFGQPRRCRNGVARAQRDTVDAIAF